MTEKLEERVLVVRRERLFAGVGEFNGFDADPDHIETVLKNIRSSFFAPRAEVEDDPSLKQMIPYCPVLCGNSVLLLKRKKTQDEKRLHNLYSLGIGGHINPSDGSTDDLDLLLENALTRELNEELLLRCEPSRSLVGLLNDDTNPVGSVHFGLVYAITVHDRDAVAIREKELMDGIFVSARELAEYADGMETWSRILLDSLNKWLL